MIGFIDLADIPNAPKEEKPSYYLCQESHSPSQVSGYLLKHSDPKEKLPPSSSHEKKLSYQQLLDDCEQKIKGIFPEKIQWSDFPVMMRISLQHLEHFLELTTAEKRSLVLEVLDNIIDSTLSHYLPLSFERTLFKAMMPPLVNLLLPDSFDKYLPVITESTLPDAVVLSEAANNIRKTFVSGFHWEDLGSAICLSVQFANHYENLSHNQKIDLAKQMVKQIVDNTPTHYLPEAFSHHIFEMIAHSIIDEIFAKL